MAESNELLKQHSAMLSTLEKQRPDHKEKDSGDIKAKMDKLEKACIDLIKKEVGVKVDKVVKEKLESSMTQMSEFMKK